MSLDDLGRRAAHDLDRTAERLEPSMPTADELVDRGRRRRAVRGAAGLVIVFLVLVAGAAFAGSGGDDGTTDVASEGESTVPTDVLDATTTTEPDECEELREEAIDGGANLFSCLELCDDSDTAEAADDKALAGRNGRSNCVPSSTAPTSAVSVPDSLDDGTTSTSIAILPSDGGTVPPDGGVPPPTPPPVEDPPTTPHTPPPPPLPSTTVPGTDAMGLVAGHVTAGPTCPVETPDASCDDIGIVATLTFTLIRDDAEFLHEETVTSSADGSYEIYLAPGTYSVITSSDAAMSCDPATVTVRADVTLDISCDTGIR